MLVSRTLLSLGNPWLDPFRGPEGIEIARQANRFFAGLEKETGGRLLGMGVLPPADIAAAAQLVREIAQTPGLHGLITGTRICGSTFDNPALDPLWQVLNATQLPILVHPHHAVAGQELTGFGHASPVAMGFTFETTIAIARSMPELCRPPRPAGRPRPDALGDRPYFLCGRSADFSQRRP